MTVQTMAAKAYQSMETATRPDGTEYNRRTDDAPEWVAEIIQAAHGDMLPDDQRYAMIRDAFSWISELDADGEPSDDAHDFADSTSDVYTSDLMAWVNSGGLRRAQYVDQAAEEFGDSRVSFDRSLAMGQYAERAEVYAFVLAGLQAVES